MNNKGFTVIELLASFALTMVITVLLFEVLIEVKDTFADTSVKTAIQQKSSIISKNIKTLLLDSGGTATCSTSTCTIGGKTLQISGNTVTINGQKFAMPDTVSIKNHNIETSCDSSNTNCYLYFQMTLTSGNLKKDYDYDVTYYY